jgi:signal transduction histidine kinase
MTDSLRLLLVGGKSETADSLRQNLNSIPNWNITLEWVSDIHTGLQIVCENRHDIGLIHQNSSPLNGIEGIRQALQRGCTRPLILCLNKEDIGLGLKAMRHGAADYLVMSRSDSFLLEKTLRGLMQCERLLQENARVQARINDSQRLESLGRMASGIAHDFNNILGIILANSELAVGAVDEHSAVHRYLSSIRLATDRAAELTNQMLAYSGRGRTRLRILDLKHLAEETIQFCRVGLPRRIGLACDIESRLPPVHGDSTQIRQILMNLVQNAADAIAGEGLVRVSAKVSQAPTDGSEACHFITPLAEGNYAVIQVTDSGCGIVQDQLGRIFDPFFSTKAPDQIT